MQAKQRASPAPPQSIDRFDRLVPRGARFIVAQAARRGDTWPHNYRESGECRLKHVCGRCRIRESITKELSMGFQ